MSKNFPDRFFPIFKSKMSTRNIILIAVLSLILASGGNGYAVSTNATDPCANQKDCESCVLTLKKHTSSPLKPSDTCMWLLTKTGQFCAQSVASHEGVHTAIETTEGCKPLTGTTTPSAGSSSSGTILPNYFQFIMVISFVVRFIMFLK